MDRNISGPASDGHARAPRRARRYPFRPDPERQSRSPYWRCAAARPPWSEGAGQNRARPFWCAAPAPAHADGRTDYRRLASPPLRDRWFADSPLEETRFEPSVPLERESLEYIIGGVRRAWIRLTRWTAAPRQIRFGRHIGAIGYAPRRTVLRPMVLTRVAPGGGPARPSA